MDPNQDLDPHEFEILDDGSSYLQAAKVRHTVGGSGGEGVEEVVLQDVGLGGDKLAFEWRSLQHVSLNQSCIGFAAADYL